MGLSRFLFLILLMIPELASGEVVVHSRGRLRQFLETLADRLDPTQLLVCHQDMGDVKTVNCGENNQQVMEDFVQAVVRLNSLRNDVRRYSENRKIMSDQGKRQQIFSLSATFQCMRKNLEKTTVYCDQSCEVGTTIAWTVLNEEIDFHLCPTYFTGLKNQWGEYQANESGRVSMIIHELSHECGTQDWNYLFSEGSTPQHEIVYHDPDGVRKVDVTHANADNYRFWALNGFCLPGYDCRSLTRQSSDRSRPSGTPQTPSP